MLKDKDSAIEDFRKMIKDSWTYHRLSFHELAWLDMTFDDIKQRLHGDYTERWHQLNNIYFAFLNALGYLDSPMHWRENEEKERCVRNEI